jgi:hypothetical protein
MGRTLKREKDAARRRHARAEQERLVRPFQRCNQRFALLDRNVVTAPVDKARGISVIRVAQIGRRHVDGLRYRPGDEFMSPRRLRRQGFQA